MAYTVPAVPLIPQGLSLSCWYASATMVVTWRREKVQACERGRPMPSDRSDIMQVRGANNGLSLDQMVAFARVLGFVTVPPQTPTLRAIESWLKSYGPLWFAGEKSNGANKYGHVWVITGVRNGELKVHDPEPVGSGSITWKDTSWFDSALRGLAATIPTNFMHYPFFTGGM